MTVDPYEALSVAKSASADEIKKAYRKIARASHPDLNPDDAASEAKFKAASNAYDLLKDPETRARYDRGEIDATGAETPDRQYYKSYAEQPGNPYRSNRTPEDFGDASDIFAEFFRQQRQGGGAQPKARGQDRRYLLEVAFMDAAIGGTSRITLPDGGMLDVKIPAGTNDQQTLRLRGKGEPGFGGGPAGDALITVSIRPHPVFRRDNADIIVSLPITIDEAVLGGKIEVPTIDGNVMMTIPRGANTGQILRLRGRGVTPVGSTERGDQRVELRIVSPPIIDETLIEFMEEWRKTHAYDPRKGMKI